MKLRELLNLRHYFRPANIGNALILYLLVGGALRVAPALDTSDTQWLVKAISGLGSFWLYALPLAPAIAALISTSSRPIPLRRLGEYGLVTATAYFSSHTLTRLSGTALWIPVEMREAVNVLVALVGDLVFAFVQHKKNVAEISLSREGSSGHGFESSVVHPEPLTKNDSTPAPQSPAPAQTGAMHSSVGNAEAPHLGARASIKQARLHQLDVNTHFFRLGMKWMAALILFFCLFMLTRALCVRGFDVRDWLADQRAENARAASARANRPLPDRIIIFQGSTTRAIYMPEFEYHVPEFVDVDRQQVYLPLWLPKDVKAKAKELGQLNDMDDGVAYMLDERPGEIFDMLEKEAGLQIGVSNCIFLLLDVFIIICAAVSSAAFFDLAAFLGSAAPG